MYTCTVQWIYIQMIPTSGQFPINPQSSSYCIFYTAAAELWQWVVSVLRIRDVYPGSRIRIFTHPGSRIQNQQQKRGVIPDPGGQKGTGSGSATLGCVLLIYRAGCGEHGELWAGDQRVPVLHLHGQDGLAGPQACRLRAGRLRL